MNPTTLREHLIGGGRIERAGRALRLSIPPTPATRYTDAQVMDYDPALRDFADVAPQFVCVRARFSSNALKGTAGFGFWNEPFAREGGVVASPCNVWFFNASLESNMVVVEGAAGCGFKAAMLSSPPLPLGAKGGPMRWVSRAFNGAANAALRVPFAARLAMRAARAMVNASEFALELDMTAWHDYELDWRNDAAVFRVDGNDVLRAPSPPHGPLGFVAWIDNYRAVASREGKYEFGFAETFEEQWLELEIASDVA